MWRRSRRTTAAAKPLTIITRIASGPTKASRAAIARSSPARRSASGLERGLLEQGKAQMKATRPDRRNEVAQLQRDFEGAVRDLKSSRLGRAGRDALYLLPWYAIIGPSGAGKTTALRNSGLRFPSVRGQQDAKVRGVGGTRNCDF